MHYILCVTLVVSSLELYAQVAPSKYWIQFTDKNFSGYSIESPLEFLSQKAIDRRLKHSVTLSDNDLPVSSFYIDSLAKLGLIILNSSKWFNAVTVYTTNTELIDTIHRLGFVANRQKVLKIKSRYSKPYSKFPKSLNPVFHSKSKTSDFYQYGVSGNQVKMMKGEFLHNKGYRGNGIQIAVIDAGFENANNLTAFTSLFQSGRILGTRDFVSGGLSVYEDHQHGTNVLSIIGGNIPDRLIGTAPEASYWLLRSEDDLSEYLIEEDNWVSAAEYADSAGVDIINTSLGYTVFDDPRMNHTYQDMDGKTTRISIAAGIAASKGMLLIISAGNEGNKTWRYISAPADSDSVLAIGSVNSSGVYSAFSSRGPTSDGRIKPDITAQGQSVVLQTASGLVVTGNGTSFSAPLVAGLAACLWQAFPDAKVWDLKNAIIESSSQFNNPDNFKGYGIPDFEKAYKILSPGYHDPSTKALSFKLFPNPFSGELFLEALIDFSGTSEYEIISPEGRKISAGTFGTLNMGEIVQLPFPAHIKQGIFILRVRTGKKFEHALIIKN